MKEAIIIKNKIRTYRFLKGELTQQDLANLVQVSRQTIIAIENFQYSPSLELAFKLSIIFECTLDELFYVDKEIPSIK